MSEMEQKLDENFDCCLLIEFDCIIFDYHVS